MDRLLDELGFLREYWIEAIVVSTEKGRSSITLSEPFHISSKDKAVIVRRRRYTKNPNRAKRGGDKR